MRQSRFGQQQQQQEDIQQQFSEQTRIGLQKDLKKLQRKLQDNKKKRSNQSQGKGEISVPQNIDTLMLKYGPSPQLQNSRMNAFGKKQDKAGEEIPSYKKDAMKLIASRIMRQIKNAFDEIQKKVMEEDLKRLKQNAKNLMNSQIEKKRIGGGLKREDSFHSNLDDKYTNQPYEGSSGKKTQFRQLFEQKKLKIKEYYENNKPQQQQQQQSQPQLEQNQESKTQQNQQVINEPKQSIENKEQNIKSQQQHHHHHHHHYHHYPEQDEIINENGESAIDSSKDENSSVNFQNQNKNKENNRYQSEDEYGEEDKQEQIEIFQKQQPTQQARVDVIQKKKQKQQKSNQQKQETSQDDQNQYPIIEEINESFEISPQKVQVGDDEIIKPSKMIKSYITDMPQRKGSNNGMQGGGNGLIIKSSRQQDVVEMSFSDNPFDKRQSFAQGSLSNINQTSPDFKSRTDQTNSFKNKLGVSSSSYLQNQKQLQQQPTQKVNEGPSANIEGSEGGISNVNHPTQGQNKKYDNFHVQGTDQSLSKISEISSEHNNFQSQRQQQQKFSDKLKQIMTEFEAVKDGQSLYTDENSSVENLPLGQEIANNKGANSSKFAQLRKKKQQNHKDMQGFESQDQDSQQQEEQKSQTGINTPLGMMFVLGSNCVMFEEKRVNNSNAKSAKNSLFTVKAKKSIQMQEHIDLKRKESSSINKQFQQLDPKIQTIKQNSSKQLYNLIQKQNLEIEKQSFMQILEYSIKRSKISLMEALIWKLKRNAVFKKFKIKSRKLKANDMIKRFLRQKVSIFDKRIQRGFWQWKINIQWYQEQVAILNRERINQASSALFLALKHKQTSILKQSLDKIKQFNKLVKKQKIDQAKSRSVQKIISFLKQKELRFLNKKFQKYRKAAFLYHYELKLMGLSKLMNQKLAYWKKESFKEIIGYCLKNQGFKQQIEELNNLNQFQRQKIVTQQLIRLVKLSKNYLIKEGFKRIKCSIQLKKQKLQSFKKLYAQMNKFEKQQGRRYCDLFWKRWVKLVEKKRKIEYSQNMSCKKIRMLFQVSNSKKIKSRFELWKHEISNFINLEFTKMIQEREIQRNLKMEQVFVNLWWSILHQSFQNIKLKSNQLSRLQLIVNKYSIKKQKQMKLNSYQVWKKRIFLFKLIKVNLQVLVKSSESRIQKQKNYYFQKWKQIKLFNQQRELTLCRIIEQKLLKIQQNQECLKEQHFAIWIGKIQKEKFCKELILKILKKEECKKIYQFYSQWRDYTLYLQGNEQKSIILKNVLQKVQCRLNFLTLKQNSLILSNKRKALYKLLKSINQKKENFQRIMFLKIKQQAKQQIQIRVRQEESVKIIKRLLKIKDLKKKQKLFMLWKMKEVKQKVNLVKKQIQSQLQRKVLSSLLQKLKIKQERIGFIEIKRVVENFKSQSQEQKIAEAISKITSATKICSIIENKRIDRIFFYLWKQQAQEMHSIFLGQQILSVITLKHKQKYFTQLKQRIQLLQIQEAKRQISLNLLRVLLFKLHKEQLQRSFNIWLLSDSRIKFVYNNLVTKPPKKRTAGIPTNDTANKEYNAFSNTNAFQGGSGGNKIFGNHSRTNSMNNSVNNQSNSARNLRYSNYEDEFDEEQEDIERRGGYYLQNKYNDDQGDYNFYQQRGQSPLRKKSDNQIKTLSRNNSSLGIMITPSTIEQQDQQRLQQEKKLHYCASMSNLNQQQHQQFLQQQQQQFLQQQQQQQQMQQKVSSTISKQKDNEQYIQPKLETDLTTSKILSPKSQLEMVIEEQDPFAKNTSKTQTNTQANFNNHNKNQLNNSNTRKKSIKYQNNLKSSQGAMNNNNNNNASINKKGVKLSSFLSSNTQNTNKLQTTMTNISNTSSQQQIDKHQKKQSQLENQQKFKMFLKGSNNSNNLENIKQRQKSKSRLKGSVSRVRFDSVVENQENSRKAQSINQGLLKLQKLFNKKIFQEPLSQVIRVVFSEEYDAQYIMKVQEKRVNKLKRVMQVREQIWMRNPYLQWEAFSIWKRLDYITMIHNLQQFKLSLDQIYSSSSNQGCVNQSQYQLYSKGKNKFK